MAGNMAWKVGKGAVQKFSGKNSHKDPTPMSVDHSHYHGAKVERSKKDGQLVLFLNDRDIGKHRKDSAFYEYQGIPKKDAKTLSHVVFWARFLDNGISAPGIPFRIGVNTLVGIIPEVGDFVGSGLSLVLVWRPAKRISNSDAPDAKKLKKVLNRNWCKGFAIGLVPIAGDFFDSWIKFNVKSADALEAMLLKRVAEGASMGGHAEKVVRTTGHQHAVSNGHHPSAITNGHHPSTITNEHHPPTITNGHHDSEPPPSSQPPRRFVGDSDLRQDRKPAASARAPTVKDRPKKSSGGTLFQRRKAPQDA